MRGESNNYYIRCVYNNKGDAPYYGNSRLCLGSLDFVRHLL